MKKIIGVFAFAMLIAVGSSCKSGDTLEKDVKKLADYQCQLKKLGNVQSPSDKVKQEIDTLTKQLTVYLEEMQTKYAAMDTVKSFQDRANKILAAEMDKCK